MMNRFLEFFDLCFVRVPQISPGYELLPGGFKGQVAEESDEYIVVIDTNAGIETFVAFVEQGLLNLQGNVSTRANGTGSHAMTAKRYYFSTNLAGGTLVGMACLEKAEFKTGPGM